MFERCQRIGLLIMGGFTVLLSILLGLLYIIPVNKSTSHENSNAPNTNITPQGTKTSNFKQYPKTIEYLNKANMKELILLPAIGKTMARRIINFRNKHFIKSTEDILNIKGIGIKKLEKIEEFLNKNNTLNSTIITKKSQATTSTSYTRLNNSKIKNNSLKKYPLTVEYLNKASIEELTLLPGIGERLAKRIIEYKNKHSIKSYHDILNIKGIGIKKLQKIEEYMESLSKDSVILKDELNSKPININTATYDDLIKIPGIGPVLAKSILNYRENKKENNKKFEDIEELLQIKGIGKKKLAKLKNYITL